jgi:hypothetical protein
MQQITVQEGKWVQIKIYAQVGFFSYFLLVNICYEHLKMDSNF